MSVHDDVERVLFTAEQIAQAVQKLGRQITRDYRGRELLLVCVLKGSLVFTADLMRAIDLPCTVDFLAASSYGDGTVTRGEVRIVKDLDGSIAGKDVLVVEDILDSGVTMAFLLKTLSARGPHSIRLCTLLDKPARRRTDVRADYVGMPCGDGFVVGYGMDYNERYRHLPYIGTLRSSCIGQTQTK